MLTGIMFGFVGKNLLDFEDIITNMRVAPEYYAISHNRVEIGKINSLRTFEDINGFTALMA
jgi:hypothetical protein